MYLLETEIAPKKSTTSSIGCPFVAVFAGHSQVMSMRGLWLSKMKIRLRKKKL